MKILVVGATGGTGRLVTDQAVERRHGVVALVRDPDSARQATPDRWHGVTLVAGDVRDASVVDAALAGVDAVICCLGVRRGQTPGTVRSDGTRTLVERMTAIGVARLVAVSSVGVGESVRWQSRPGRYLWPRLVGRDRLAEATLAESFVRASDLAWTLVRPPRLVDTNPGRPPSVGRVALGPDVRTGLNSRLSRTDLARTLLDLLDDERWTRTAVTVTTARP